MIALIHYGEIGLKGKNRKYFEEKLASNVRKVLGKDAKVNVEQKRLFAEGTFTEKNAREKLGKVFGIEWFAIAEECAPETEAIWKCVKKNLKRVGGKKFAVRAKRSDKNFPMGSMELSGEIGKRVLDSVDAKVDLKNPEITVFVEIMQGKALVFFEKVRGLRGLPVGVGGRVICLMSGGIDSPVAAYFMMKRGCEVDFLHVHSFDKNGKVKGSKIEKLVKSLDEYQQRKAKLWVVPYAGFYARTGEVERRYELVVFRKYLYKLAERVAQEKNYGGVVSGDSLGQVASQTLENIAAAQSGLEVPVFRPLVSMDKMEIVDVAERIGTYEESIKEYQDCCSLVAVKSPVTKARKHIVDEYYGEMKIGELILESMGELEGI
jgi:thiamine biosynthesis protein ThiI